jgi:hypothetical protein
MFPRLYKVSSAPTTSISKMKSWVNGSYVWNANWRRTPIIFEIEQEISWHRVLQEVKLSNTKSDLKVWNLCTDGKFTMQSCTTLINSIECSGSCPFQTQVWKFMAPPKIQNFIWLGIQNKLCTRSFLYSCLLLSLDRFFFPFYTNVIETSDHVLIHYQFIWKLWTILFSWWGISWCFPNILDELLHR